MKSAILFFCYLVTLLLCFSKISFATLHLNEIYPAPVTGEFEWVELYNDENNLLNITGYYLSDLANNKIKLATDSIQPLGFIIATSSSILNNSGDTVYLKNNLNEILEIATYSGNFDNNKSYSRCPDGTGDWFTLNIITKNVSNDLACFSLTPTPTPLPTETPIPTSQPTPTPTQEALPSASPTPITYENIFISEVMVNPTKGENEWVEIYNNNDCSVELNNWFIDDAENSGSSPKLLSLTIAAKSYAVFDLTSSMFNNSGDQIRLLDFNKSVKDSFEYQDSVANETYGRISFEDDNFCLQEPSKGLVNNSCINPTVEPTNTSTPTKIPTTVTKSIALPTNIVYQSQRIINKNVMVPTQSADVLGVAAATTIAPTHSPNPLIKSFSLASFGYSLLSFISIILKIKKLSL